MFERGVSLESRSSRSKAETPYFRRSSRQMEMIGNAKSAARMAIANKSRIHSALLMTQSSRNAW